MTDAARPSDRPVPDSLPATWVERAPAPVRPYLRLARYDRPVGFWLVLLPAWMGLALARAGGGWAWTDAAYAALYVVGALAMRGAGCTINDIIDRDLDARVARTADRPLAAGVISLRAGVVFLAAQSLVALAALFALPPAAQIVALAAVPFVALYPLMKRVTWFPQAWLGVTINWGVLVAYATATGTLRPEAFLLHLALAAWTFGYDTIYAHQDLTDDAQAGVKSAARLFGRRSFQAIGAAYVAAAGLAALAALIAAGGIMTAPLVVVAAFGGALFAQLAHVDLASPPSCLATFKRNTRAGGLLIAALLAAAPLSDAVAALTGG